MSTELPAERSARVLMESYVSDHKNDGAYTLELDASDTAELWRRVENLFAENAVLAQWKKEQLTVLAWWDELDDFVRSHPDAPLGKYVSMTALAWLKERDVLRTRASAAETLAEALAAYVHAEEWTRALEERAVDALDSWHATASNFHPKTNMKTAITELEIAISTLENNEPIRRSEGRIEQADSDVAKLLELRHALNILRACSATPSTP